MGNYIIKDESIKRPTQTASGLLFESYHSGQHTVRGEHSVDLERKIGLGGQFLVKFWVAILGGDALEFTTFE